MILHGFSSMVLVCFWFVQQYLDKDWKKTSEPTFRGSWILGVLCAVYSLFSFNQIRTAMTSGICVRPYSFSSVTVELNTLLQETLSSSVTEMLKSSSQSRMWLTTRNSNFTQLFFPCVTKWFFRKETVTLWSPRIVRKDAFQFLNCLKFSPLSAFLKAFIIWYAPSISSSACCNPSPRSWSFSS